MLASAWALPASIDHLRGLGPVEAHADRLTVQCWRGGQRGGGHCTLRGYQECGYHSGYALVRGD